MLRQVGPRVARFRYLVRENKYGHLYKTGKEQWLRAQLRLRRVYMHAPPSRDLSWADKEHCHMLPPGQAAPHTSLSPTPFSSTLLFLPQYHRLRAFPIFPKPHCPSTAAHSRQASWHPTARDSDAVHQAPAMWRAESGPEPDSHNTIRRDEMCPRQNPRPTMSGRRTTAPVASILLGSRTASWILPGTKLPPLRKGRVAPW
jgi:hypothetical protein